MKESDLLYFMDTLDLDEELINSRLESVMSRKSFTYQHLSNVMHMLNYKHLLNIKEAEECDNDAEFQFIGKLIEQVDEKHVDIICEIVSVVLCLSPSTIVFKSEHLLQQLLSISFEKQHIECEETHLLTTLKLCDSVLEAVARMGKKLSLPFLDVPLENIVVSQNEPLKKHFLTKTVKRLFDGVLGYNILDRVWSCTKKITSDCLISLNILCALADFYLPLPNECGVIFLESNIISQNEFWEINLRGLSSKLSTHRKLAIYLLKRAVDCLLVTDKNIKIISPSVSLEWVSEKKEQLKDDWENFFILIDSLEEKQSNIVLPSLHLFSLLKGLEKCWVNCAFNIGLQHDNLEVKTTCILHRLENSVTDDSEAIILLESFNDMNIFDHEEIGASIKQKFEGQIRNSIFFIIVLKNIPCIKWSPIPLYHLSTILAKKQDVQMQIDSSEFYKFMYDLLKVPCNNVVIRNAFYKNLSSFVGNCCKDLHWKNILHLFNLINPYLCNFENCGDILDIRKDGLRFNKQDNALYSLIKDKLSITDLNIFFKELKQSYFNIDFILLYLIGHVADLNKFLKISNEMLLNIKNGHHKSECIGDAIFLMVLLRKVNEGSFSIPRIKSLLIDNSEMLIEFVNVSLSETNNEPEDILLMLDNYQDLYNLHCQQAHNNIYENAITILKDGTDIRRNITSVYLLNIIFQSSQKHELQISASDTIRILTNVNKLNTNVGNGKLRNLYNSKATEFIYVMAKYYTIENVTDIIDFMNNALESGDCDSIRWILNIINLKIEEILECKHFKLSQFLRKLWNEIEAIKTNKEYSNCIEGFVQLITNEALLKQPAYNNEVIAYCNKIIEYAMVKNMPLYYLVEALEKDYVLTYGHMVYIFGDILLAVAVPRRDIRITDNLLVEISKEYNLRPKDGVFTTFHIEYKTLEVLGKIQNKETLNIISRIIMKKIDELFKHKQRYHRNSTLHRILHAGLQHLLFILRNNKDIDIFQWCVEFLGRIPHQASTRLYLEWCIALGIFYKEINVANTIQLLQTNSVPITSQFMILYWYIKTSNSNEELKLVLDYLLENTMGPTYSIRLHAQYLLSKIDLKSFKIAGYEQAIIVVNKTLTEAAKLKEKSLERLTHDYFVHEFDIIKDLTPCAIYYSAHNERVNEKIDENYAAPVLGVSELKKFNTITTEVKDVEMNATSLIQKKYIPWKNMCDVGVDVDTPINKTELIVVASLIDKLPNLGGMARTSEIFAVNTYVIDSLRHLQDKQFQGLSVSAERWVNVIEVRPGQPLKDYLALKKSEGYAIVAAEQTSNSTSLQGFKFPKKTLLLLGNEKSGIPCDLLPHMDICVEVPQRGVLRSLNVHVTAAIFIWEYTRQHM
ncbi:unnamed protein product [Pieris macdunnoughi]|uniref:tRNA (guanosine(18)-2'-O)-methyltransferase TARBP1 n=1 Tax=Pieris macdunnoughi TaxID=345717 RepID=A0A821URP7_9NEOP|nr:unnamed protein product [Pieris macdunnoughi]